MTSELRFAGGAPLTLKVSPRARVMRLRVDPRTGAVLLTMPKRMSRRRALDWAAGQSAWVEAALAGMPEAVPIAPGSVLPLYGVPHRVDWSAGRPRRIEVAGAVLAVGGPLEGLEARVLRWLKRHARDVLDRETRSFAEQAGRPVLRVAVGDPLSRWGSCSASGAIRYSWRLILAPQWVRRATVAHEVAHLVHMDHGRAFHALVEELLGEDPRPARVWLRSEGAALHRIGRA
ncbi:M48 family metallopeptidase [Allosphingosinicella sp.]|uniref:M48 family metallopeptidase n=1 Tax=Allosphingosinicella sp. TaxID=2823234 RepID=UPI002F19C306